MFNESNTVEAYVRDLLAGPITAVATNAVQEPQASYGPSAKGIGWRYAATAEVPRQIQEVLVEPWLRNALIRINPEIAAQPDRADEVLYKLRAIVLSVRSDGLIRANEEMTAWMRGERSMPFGDNNEHVPVRLIDLDDLAQNQYVVTQQYTYRAGPTERRADLVLLVNGLPLVLIEAKTPVKKCISWVDGAVQVHDDYEKFVPELFVCNVFSVATEGKAYRYGSIGLPVKDWGPWHLDGDGDDGQHHPLKSLKLSAESMLRPHVVLDILGSFTLFATNKKKQRIKIICRYQQFEAANKIVERVLMGYPRKGLIWHFQGSGKSLLMVFAAQKLRMHAGLKNPTVLIVVDRVDLDSQITGTFTGADIPNLEKADSREKLQQLLAQDVRKIIITTIFKFGEAAGSLNDRSNIIALVDEAHRTQEGGLGRKMREALPNAFLFGLTGTPINRADRNTFYAFGADEDEKGYMSRYGFEESIRDGATLKLHFEPRLIDLHIDKAALDAAYKDLTGGLSDLDKDNLAKTAAKMAVLVKTPERIHKVCEDIVEHFQTKVEPNGFKGQIVTFDRESCLLFKAELDKLLPPEATDIVMSVRASDKKEHPEYAAYDRSRDDEERLLDRFRDPADPLKLIIVTAKLLTGFDAPILQAMYLDKPLRDHTLLQAICRVNRTYSEQKTHGLIVDYLGIFDDVAAALEFDDQSVKQVVSNIQELKDKLPEAMQKCLAFFAGCDRSLQGYEGLIAAQQCLPNNEVRDNFAAEYSVLNKIWEALSPDTVLGSFEKDYKWLSQVYQSVQPSSGHGKLIWHSLGAKTIELIHQNVHVDAVRDDLDTLVLDADLLEAVLSNPDPKKAREIEIKLKRRLRGHGGNPKFKKLSERLDALKDRFESGQINSVEFLKQLLEIAKETLQAEKDLQPEEHEDRGKAALTELFNEIKTSETPIIVERVVSDIDEIVRLVRFPGWQSTQAGEREVKKVLRKALFKYKLHVDEELFEKAYSYIKQYY
ncbi:DEAD/DEAH box helicase [Stenotrophomonas maltophilia]|uniref:type I restriction endonuclease subunit R n=1 Tax=Stenotrophomonas TaxID=40323 RepID=UPI000C256229|nr:MULTISPECIES: HsdR family type I site-specific deoxyribonuclease [unclassified Stenotrophomonas]MDH1242767.1 HsdR family type I site-specific deoxyribonuclease [Stenotrophomonas sp. GD03948]MDH1577356.1 HsdR family type I site-specific deoxyribonuclease [Stenotrophomonas sp. GD03744]PJL78880.1 DEAD/DEAH box helicase [Stenotrophomonas maltophilia]PZT32763.1 DEAD/DEAH box helicase [Stenotrophomonas maltophilia]